MASTRHRSQVGRGERGACVSNRGFTHTEGKKTGGKKKEAKHMKNRSSRLYKKEFKTIKLSTKPWNTPYEEIKTTSIDVLHTCVSL